MGDGTSILFDLPGVAVDRVDIDELIQVGGRPSTEGLMQYVAGKSGHSVLGGKLVAS
jgi:hypothetical protein